MSIATLFYRIVLILLSIFTLALIVVNKGFQYNETCDLDAPVRLVSTIFQIKSVTDRIVSTKYDEEEKDIHGSTMYIVKSTCDVFSQSYVDARRKFREAVQLLDNKVQQEQSDKSNSRKQQRITLDRVVVVSAGSDHEYLETTTLMGDKNTDDDKDYTMDIAVIHGDRPGLVIHTSGVHGIEGYTGSAIQITFLKLMIELSQQKDQNITAILSHLPTIVIIHAVNPFGMAHYRRWNENNVDLNRNGLTPAEWGSEYVKNHFNREMYESLDRVFLNPVVPPTWFSFSIWHWLRALKFIIQYGIPRLKAANVGGQYYNPKGIFYGGNRVEASIRQLSKWLDNFLHKEHLPLTAPNIATTWVDVHTGLGRLGDDTFFPSLRDENTFNELELWFQGKNSTPNSRPSSKSVTTQVSMVNSHKVNGSAHQGYERVRGGVITYFHSLFFHHQDALLFSQEFGTVPVPLVGQALVYENSAYHYCPTVEEKKQWARKLMKPVFYPESQYYRKSILINGLRVFQQAIQRTIHLSSKVSSTSSSSHVENVTEGLPIQRETRNVTNEGQSDSMNLFDEL